MAYEIKNVKGHRKYNTKYIIISQVKNLFPTGIPLDPSITQHNKRYSWGKWQKYFYEQTYQFRLPCHYYLEYLDDDYVIYNGLGINEKSYFIEDLILNNVIDFKYKDSLLILLKKDLDVDRMTPRMLDHLCNKVICPLMIEYNISRNSVINIDDILKPNWEDNQLKSKLDYGITKGRFYDEIMLTQSINKYKKLN